MACDHGHKDKVVIIHGRAAAMEVPGQFGPQFEDALRFGLKRVGYEAWRCVPVEVPFYGELWRPDQYLPVPDFDPGVRNEGKGIPTIGDAAEWAIEFADQFGILSGGILELMLRDVKEYFTLEAVREATDAIVLDAIGDAEVVTFVGFSMGSLVGYHILSVKQPPAVRYFVTCGSPIGSRRFYKYVRDLSVNRQPRFPDRLMMWANIWDDRDTATKVFDLTRLFPSTVPGRVVQSARSYGRPPARTNPFTAHNASDYLSSKSLGAAVMSALRAGSPPATD